MSDGTAGEAVGDEDGVAGSGVSVAVGGFTPPSGTGGVGVIDGVGVGVGVSVVDGVAVLAGMGVPNADSRSR